ncbi:hypothetical protein KXD40_002626 [Peronospora effusa]|nr:hypothetical protein KXD40_002626 [Peronospora effusa]
MHRRSIQECLPHLPSTVKQYIKARGKSMRMGSLDNKAGSENRTTCSPKFISNTAILPYTNYSPSATGTAFLATAAFWPEDAEDEGYGLAGVSKVFYSTQELV